MWAIPLWAYAVVVLFSLFMIIGLLALVFKLANPSREQGQDAAPRKEKRQNKQQQKKESNNEEEEEEDDVRPQRRGGLARMQVRRRGRPVAVDEESEEEAEGAGALLPESGDEEEDLPRADKKIGAKKLAKLQRKEEARQYRQAEEERRAERKEREEREERERLRRKEEEKEQERQEKEYEEQRKREREEREQEEFNRWKDFIEVEAEGSVKAELEEKKAKLAFFADHVKKEKVVLLEDLAITFGLQTQEVIDELKKAELEGRLTGVIDERGKYIYISPEEMDAVAKFIKYRGRVSIREIAAESNKLIKMNPEKTPDEESLAPSNSEGMVVQ